MKFGFTCNKCDPSLSTYSHGTSSTYVLVYVATLVTGASTSFIQELIVKLYFEFAMKDLKTLHYFLGLEVHHLTDGSLLLS